MRAEPLATIEWTKDSVPIIRGDPKYQQVDHPDGLCELFVSNPNDRDSGKYVCKAANPCGTAEIAHFVLFEGIAAHIAENIHGVFHHDQKRAGGPKTEAARDATNGVENGNADAAPEETKENGAAENGTAAAPAEKGKAAKGKKAEAPPSGGGRRYQPAPPPNPKEQLFFRTFLNDRTVAEGTKVKLQCIIEGPDPQLRWFKDETQLQMSPRCRAEIQDGLASLVIQNALIEDDAVYRVLARNQASEITCSCKLNVYEAIKSVQTPPIFTGSIKGKTFCETKKNACMLCVRLVF